MDAAAGVDRKRSRDDESTSLAPQTIYVHCKHMNKVWDLLNGFFFQCRAEIGISTWYERASAGGGAAEPPKVEDDDATTAMVAKKDAPVEIVFASWSRKPYFLVEFSGIDGSQLASRLLALPHELRTFRGVGVDISPAQKGQSVASEREKSAVLSATKTHTVQERKPGAESSSASAELSKPQRQEPQSAEVQPPSGVRITSFVPRVVKKR